MFLIAVRLAVKRIDTFVVEHDLELVIKHAFRGLFWSIKNSGEILNK